MEERKVFCEECRDDVCFCVDEVKTEGTIKGERYSYLGRKAHCNNCGSEIYVTGVNDYNLKALYDAYREKNEIVSLEVILAIPQKYAIGKRPLSLLLGWGEQTFSRYCDGDMPTKQYSEMLLRLYNDPRYYSEILESNKGYLKSTASYEKSRKAVDAILGNAQNTKSKIDLTIEYLANQCEDISPLALQRALYYIQGFYYAFYNKFLFIEDCEAWVSGPVYKDIYLKYCDYHYDLIDVDSEDNCSVFSSSEKAIVDSVIKNVCCYSGMVLEQFTHSETPWLSTRGELPATAVSNRTIEKELIANYFCAVKEKYYMINPSDIKGYAQNMFERR